MDFSAELAHRLQFAFTITYHYLFPQLTMGLALIIVIFKAIALRTRDPIAAAAVTFWIRVFALAFVMGVVTGIPMEFQFGTNWARFAEGGGAVIGQLLAMEGVFAFFLESAFLGLVLAGERRVGPRLHAIACVCVWLGSWTSGFFIVATNAWMQRPVGYVFTADGGLELSSLGALLTNEWLVWQYPHVILGALVTGGAVVAAIGALYTLLERHREHARAYLRVGVTVGALAALLAAFPTGDMQAKNVLAHQPVTFAAMEGHFHSERGAPMVLVGQPDMERRRLDNAIAVPNILSLMTHYRWDSEIRGLDEWPVDEWPDNVPLLYYAYHIMVGLGTVLIAALGGALLLLRGDRLLRWRWPLWILTLCAPLPFIANTAGWITAEAGRQPWLIYGLMRTAEGTSPHVSAGNVLFSLLGFMGLYALLSLLFVALLLRILAKGPGNTEEHA
ncbi:MAG: cytochrome ubiquinol oxidase subunit I [Nannocystaceae bacterium]